MENKSKMEESKLRIDKDSEDYIEILKNSKKIRKLKIFTEGFEVLDSFCEILRTHPSIEKLSFYYDSDCKVFLEILGLLNENAKITCVKLLNFSIDSEESKQIGEILANLKYLKKFVHLSEDGSNYTHFKGMCEGFQKNKSITSIHFSGIELDDYEEDYFSLIFNSNRNIQEFFLDGINHVGDFHKIVSSLVGYSSLTSLSLVEFVDIEFENENSENICRLFSEAKNLQKM